VTYEPFGFSRQAKLPGGDEVTVGFSLAFVTHDDMPRAAFFTCQQHAPEHFWKPEYQRHANTAKSIGEVALVCEQPLHYVGFLENLTGLKALQEDAHAVRFETPRGWLTAYRPDSFARSYGFAAPSLADGPVLPDIALRLRTVKWRWRVSILPAWPGSLHRPAMPSGLRPVAVPSLRFPRCSR
jgi:hypothetical protein